MEFWTGVAALCALALGSFAAGAAVNVFLSRWLHPPRRHGEAELAR